MNKKAYLFFIAILAFANPLYGQSSRGWESSGNSPVLIGIKSEGRDVFLDFSGPAPDFLFTNSEQGIVVQIPAGVKLPGPLTPRILNLQSEFFSRVVIGDSTIALTTLRAYQFVQVSSRGSSIRLRAEEEDQGDIARSGRYAERGASSFPVRTRIGFATVLRFKSPVQFAIVGEQNFFRVEIIHRATADHQDFVVIKPLTPEAKSSLVVIAQDGTYMFSLYEDPHSSPYIIIDVPSRREFNTTDPFVSMVSHGMRIASGEVRDPNAKVVDLNESRPILIGGVTANLQHIRTVFFRDIEVHVFQIANLTGEDLIIQPERFYFDESVFGVGVETDKGLSDDRRLPPGDIKVIYLVRMSAEGRAGVNSQFTNPRRRVSPTTENIERPR